MNPECTVQVFDREPETLCRRASTSRCKGKLQRTIYATQTLLARGGSFTRLHEGLETASAGVNPECPCTHDPGVYKKCRLLQCLGICTERFRHKSEPLPLSVLVVLLLLRQRSIPLSASANRNLTQVHSGPSFIKTLTSPHLF